MFIEVQTRTTINDPMRVKKGENKQKHVSEIGTSGRLRHYFALRFLQSSRSRSQFWFSIQCLRSNWHLKIVRFDPPMLDLKYLLDTGTIRSGLWHVL